MIDYKLLNSLRAEDYKFYFNKYKELLLSNPDTAKYVVDKTIEWQEFGYNVIQIRCNDLFVTNDIQAYNDWMVTIDYSEKVEGVVEVYAVTVDPKVRRDEIFNVLEQITRRHVGYHKWSLSRIALRQDSGKLDYRTWGARFTRKAGQWIKREVLGFFTIHTHDNGGFGNSSLGCTILKSLDTYKRYFKPALTRLKKLGLDKNIPMAIMRDKTFEDLLGSRAIAVNGVNSNKGIAKP